MTLNFVNPYTGTDDQTCSVSFAAQGQMGMWDPSSGQTEAEFNKSKQLGEWGVIAAKLNKGEIPNGTKVLTYENESGTARGYFYVKGGQLHQQAFFKGKKLAPAPVGTDAGEDFIKKGNLKTAIPQAVAAKPKPEPVPFTEEDGKALSSDVTALKNGQVLAVAPSGDFIAYNTKEDKFELYGQDPSGSSNGVLAEQSYYMPSLMSGNTWAKPDGKASTPKITPKVAAPASPPPKTIASPTPSPAVTPGSTSVGSMSHEDIAAMFVKIKDDLAKQQGLNIKGANPQLDQLVYSKIGDGTGYTAAEVKAKIDAYKADGNKLSALKKKVLAGTKKVPEGKPIPAKQTGDNSPLASPTTKAKQPDPKPNGVPTQATPKLADQIKAKVKKEADKDPAKVYSDEDVASAYIIAKDAIVANNTKGWTLYTKNDEFDLEIAIQVGMKTGLNPTQQKQAIAQYLASGKKLSALKKQLAKQGAFKPQAATLKSGKASPDPDKTKDVNAKADAGYTPTPEPATKAKANEPKIDTGKPAPKKVVDDAQEAGDISGIPDSLKNVIYSKFKANGSQSYLSSGPGSNYEGFADVQAAMKVAGHDLSLLQLIRVIDEQGAKKAGVDNGKLFEKQVATWLTTPDGTKYVNDKKVQLAAKAEKAAKEAAAKAEALRLAKELEANQPPLPADSALFETWDLAKARRISNTWLAKEPWTAKQKAGLRHYTGSAYIEMNGYLRDPSSSIGPTSKGHIQGTKEGMRPTTERILVKRGTGLNQFSTLGLNRGDKNLVWGLTGKTFKDEGFLSTSAGGKEAFSSKEATLEIECPIGTPMAYVDPISKVPGEKEMLLQAGMEYKIIQVRMSPGGKPIIRMRVVNWPGKVN